MCKKWVWSSQLLLHILKASSVMLFFAVAVVFLLKFFNFQKKNGTTVRFPHNSAEVWRGVGGGRVVDGLGGRGVVGQDRLGVVEGLGRGRGRVVGGGEGVVGLGGRRGRGVVDGLVHGGRGGRGRGVVGLGGRVVGGGGGLVRGRVGRVGGVGGLTLVADVGDVAVLVVGVVGHDLKCSKIEFE